MVDEDLVTYFENKLYDPSGKPAIVLEQFCSALYDKPFMEKHIPFFAKAVKIYGRELVFLSILDTWDIDNIDPNTVLRLIGYFIKKRAEQKLKHTDVVDLSKSVEESITKLAKFKDKKVEVVNPFDG